MTIDKAEKETLSDGSEVLYLELLYTHEGKQHRIHEIIQTQERLDEFLASIGYPPGAMKLAQGRK